MPITSQDPVLMADKKMWKVCVFVRRQNSCPYNSMDLYQMRICIQMFRLPPQTLSFIMSEQATACLWIKNVAGDQRSELSLFCQVRRRQNERLSQVFTLYKPPGTSRGSWPRNRYLQAGCYGEPPSPSLTGPVAYSWDRACLALEGPEPSFYAKQRGFDRQPLY